MPRTRMSGGHSDNFPQLKFLSAPARLERMGRFASTFEFLCSIPGALSARVFSEGCGGDRTAWRRNLARRRLRTRNARHWFRTFCWKLHRTRSRTPNDRGGAGCGGGSRGCTFPDRRSDRGVPNHSNLRCRHHWPRPSLVGTHSGVGGAGAHSRPRLRSHFDLPSLRC